MATFLFTWGRHVFDDLPAFAEQVKAGAGYGNWSTGNRKDIPPGSEFFLLRQRKEPRGIVGYGHTVGDVYQDDHWDVERAKLGEKANSVDVFFERFIDPVAEPSRVLKIETLQNGEFENSNWVPFSSGQVRISDADGHRLKSLFDKLQHEVDLANRPETTQNPDWTQDEHILALDLYFRFNPSKIGKKHASVVELSDFLNRLPIHPQALRGETFRNPDSVYMKLCNFLRLDPSYKGKGLSAGSKGEEVVWNMYYGNRSELTKIVEAIKASGERQILLRLTQPLDDDDEAFPEGRVLTREHKTRERNRQLVERKKKAVLAAKGKLECEVCGFDFFETYDELGREFAECHHLAPLSDLREEKVTKLSEVSIVCANCHRMLHRARPWKTIGELKAIVARE
jgi:5-methylcytosine-specific restriction enzyme A